MIVFPSACACALSWRVRFSGIPSAMIATVLIYNEGWEVGIAGKLSRIFRGIVHESVSVKGSSRYMHVKCVIICYFRSTWHSAVSWNCEVRMNCIKMGNAIWRDDNLCHTIPYHTALYRPEGSSVLRSTSHKRNGTRQNWSKHRQLDSSS